ncbi:65 kDa invariant surface glycoprotein, putative [Trypanosoma brucei gambiense DAL972]|uniref:65 kDa invariant surface glycoprotein, putative n=1 Tax=Trypanosoma brucei gambiense (strain MHOM/CI/86/DAL972) TaxID=679716 RepID=C9ZNS5_TRYB9|nr:65 kDa invariant surface glycoprotein, putative [Trypanosoma brucei gambiense DAL972]CBH11053.1 65 kDa invariant surface glycoprotein, putative [Trypanosoma brucei gambiense DAL972]|eukprot:XP_011773340.1 65 kDa invariant surface glycoprotein, putative [Trypanosoma brucei gambiense DAL972]
MIRYSLVAVTFAGLLLRVVETNEEAKLTKDGALALCKLTDLSNTVATKRADKIKDKTEGFAGDIQWWLESLERWLQTLQDPGQSNNGYSKLSDADVKKVKDIYEKAKDKLNEQLPEAKKWGEEAKKHCQSVTEAAKKARGWGLDDDGQNSSGLHQVLEWWCGTKEGNAKNNNCEGVKFKTHYSGTERNTIDCEGVGHKTTLYNDISSGTMKQALEDWEKKKPQGEEPVKNNWKTHYNTTVQKLKELEESHHKGKKTHDDVSGFYNAAHVVHSGLSAGKPLSEVLVEAKEASKRGAKITNPGGAAPEATQRGVGTSTGEGGATETTGGSSSSSTGTGTTSETESEVVGADADFGDLLETSDRSALSSKIKESKVILMAVLIPVAILAIITAVVLVFVRRRRGNAEDVIDEKGEAVSSPDKKGGATSPCYRKE